MFHPIFSNISLTQKLTTKMEWNHPKSSEKPATTCRLLRDFSPDLIWCSAIYCLVIQHHQQVGHRSSQLDFTKKIWQHGLDLNSQSSCFMGRLIHFAELACQPLALHEWTNPDDHESSAYLGHGMRTLITSMQMCMYNLSSPAASLWQRAAPQKAVYYWWGSGQLRERPDRSGKSTQAGQRDQVLVYCPLVSPGHCNRITFKCLLWVLQTQAHC